MKIRAALAAIAVTLGITAFAVLAAEAPASAATTCYGGARTISYAGIGLYPTSGAYKTTTRCRDINMRVAKGTVHACVVFVDKTKNCNRWTTVGTKWVTIATNVKDNVRYAVGIEGNDNQFGLKMYVAG